MVYTVEIDNAVISHAVWKDRLLQAVRLGELAFPVEVIEVDNLCAFGKWLYGPSLSPDERDSSTFAEIRQLHAEFHRTAARVARLVETGHLNEARRLLRPGDEYEQLSTRLTAALIRWREALREQPAAR